MPKHPVVKRPESSKVPSGHNPKLPPPEPPPEPQPPAFTYLPGER